MLHTGIAWDVIELARCLLRHGMPSGGYVLATNNCVCTGMALDRYDLIMDVWCREGDVHRHTEEAE